MNEKIKLAQAILVTAIWHKTVDQHEVARCLYCGALGSVIHTNNLVFTVRNLEHEKDCVVLLAQDIMDRCQTGYVPAS